MTLRAPELKKNEGFTLVELMVTVGIVVILSVIGFVSLNARVKNSRLETAVQSLVADLSYARTTAMLKGCPTRFIMCGNSTCSDAASVTSSSGRIGTASGGPSRFYAIMRMSQAYDTNSMCFNSNSIPSTTDGFADWDYDKKPINLPTGVSFFPIYPSGALAQGNWSSFSSTAATNSVYFETDGDLSVPLTDVTANATGSSLAYRVVFQLGFDDCAASSSDCNGFLVGIPANGGTAKYFRCDTTAARTSGTLYSNRCW